MTDLIEAAEATLEEQQEAAILQAAYQNSFDGDGRKVLKDRLNELGLFRMIEAGNEGSVILHNEAIRLLMKIGILKDKDSVDAIIDAMMDITIRRG